MNSKEGSSEQMQKLPVEIPDTLVPGEPDSAASKEVAAFSQGWGWFLSFIQYERPLNISLKVCLFIFVITMNIWWTHRVLQLIWVSADSESAYHLDNSVLIALVTTSLANFLALVGIVAKHLFPSSK
jgi:hypothetical protein